MCDHDVSIRKFFEFGKYSVNAKMFIFLVGIYGVLFNSSNSDNISNL